MNNSPPMRKWVLLSKIIYFVLGTKLYADIVGTTVREVMRDIFIPLVTILPRVHKDVASREGQFYASFFVVIAPFWIVKKIRQKGFYYLEKVFPKKSRNELKDDFVTILAFETSCEASARIMRAV